MKSTNHVQSTVRRTTSRNKRRNRPVLEALEHRRLLAADAIASVHDSISFQTSGQSLWAAGTSAEETAAFSTTLVDSTRTLDIDESADVPNPLVVAYDVALDACKDLGFSGSECKDGIDVPGLGEPPEDAVELAIYETALELCKVALTTSQCKNGIDLPGLGDRPGPATLTTGLDVDATIGFNFGFEGDVTVDPGSVDVDYPTEVWVEATGVDDIVPGEIFTITTSQTVNSPTLTTDFSEIDASFGIFYDISADLDVEATVLGVEIIDSQNNGFNTGPRSQELFGANVGDGGLTVRVGSDPLITFQDGIEQQIGVVKTGLYVPDLDTGPTQHSSVTGDTITNTLLPVTRGAGGVTDIDFAKLTVDIDSVATTAAGLGMGGLTLGLSDPIGAFTLDATLLNAEVGPFFGIGQTMTFDANLMVELQFSQPTEVETSPGVFESKSTWKVPVGTDVRAKHPGGDVDIDTVYSLANNTFTNDTDLLLSNAFIVDVLKLELGGTILSTLGLDANFCVYCDSFALGDPMELTSITDTSFSLEGFSDVTGSSLSIPSISPPALALNTVASIDENGSAILSGVISDLNQDEEFTLDLDWGDTLSPGNTQQIVFSDTAINAGGITWDPVTRTFSVSHQFLDDPTSMSQGTYVITALVTDCSLEKSSTESETVVVSNVAPSIDTLSVTSMIDEDGTVTLTGTYSDVGTLDTHKIDVDWGMGETSDLGVSVSGGSFSITHQYLDDDPTMTPQDSYTITVTLTDDDTGSDSTSTSTLVKNVDPSINTLNVTPMIDEDGTVTLTGTYSDVGTLDTHKIDVNWGMGETSDLGVSVSGGSFSITHQYLDDDPTMTPQDSYTVTVTLTDDDTGSDSTSTSTLVKNVAPSIDTVSVTPMINEDGTVTLTGTYSDVGTLDTHKIDVDWGMGETSDLGVSVSGGSFSITHQYLDDNPTMTPQDSYTITVTLTDDDTGSDSTSTSTLVKNVDPVITSFVTSATKGQKAVAGESIAVSGVFTDVGTLDSHTVIIDWQDGTTSRSDQNPEDFVSFVDNGATGSFTASHTYSTGGIFTASVTVLDDDTGTTNTSTLVWVSGMRIDPTGVLQIVGTSEDDHVSINERANGQGVVVHASSLLDRPFEVFSAASVVSIVSYLCEGDDHLNISGNIELPAVIHGDGGNDHLHGGGSAAVLLGGSGDDMIVGGPGNALLIGGIGLDRLVASSGGDVLIGGSTTNDDDNNALLQMVAEWNNGDPYADRVAAIDASLSVVDDNDADLNTGSDGLDLFYAGIGDTLTDVDISNESIL